MALTTKRIIALPSQTDPQEGDYLAIDNLQGGTHKIPVGRIGVEVDDTLTEAGKAADAKATGDAIDEIRSQVEVTGTASGAIATFTDGAEMPAKSVIVNIVPKQSGTGTPSPDNVRQISGWESVNVHANSMNLFPNTLGVQSVTKNGVTFDITEENGFITDIYMHGTATGSGSLSFATTDNGFQLPKGILKMYLAGDKTTSDSRFDLNIRRVGASQDIVATTAVKTITNDEVSDFGSAYIYFYNGAVLNHHIMPCIVPNDVDTSEYPKYPIHNGTTTTVNLGRTVYGGTLDVVSGELTAYPFYPSYNGETLDGRWICDRAVYAEGTTPPTGSQVALISGTGTTYQLTPTEVKTLLGENNVWADSGDVEVVYVRDLNITINNLIGA